MSPGIPSTQTEQHALPVGPMRPQAVDRRARGGSVRGPVFRAPLPTLDLRVQVGPVDRTLRVFGTRVWEQTLLGGLAPSAPLPFESVPVKWELAFGGADFSDPKRPLEEPRNPAGTGLVRDASELLHKAVPQIEDPRDLLTSARSRPAPAGLGAIARHWAPRRAYAGTYDEAWKRDRMPLPPLDLDARFHQCAPPEMVAPAPLRGGEPVFVENMSEGGCVRSISRGCTSSLARARTRASPNTHRCSTRCCSSRTSGASS